VWEDGRDRWIGEEPHWLMSALLARRARVLVLAAQAISLNDAVALCTKVRQDKI
jgi:hypothetical protein